MKDLFAIATLVVVGIMLADVVTHPKGVAAAGAQMNALARTGASALLGTVPSGYKSVSG